MSSRSRSSEQQNNNIATPDMLLRPRWSLAPVYVRAGGAHRSARRNISVWRGQAAGSLRPAPATATAARAWLAATRLRSAAAGAASAGADVIVVGGGHAGCEAAAAAARTGSSVLLLTHNTAKIGAFGRCRPPAVLLKINPPPHPLSRRRDVVQPIIWRRRQGSHHPRN